MNPIERGLEGAHLPNLSLKMNRFIETSYRQRKWSATDAPQRNVFRVMKDVALHTRVSPEQRQLVSCSIFQLVIVPFVMLVIVPFVILFIVPFVKLFIVPWFVSCKFLEIMLFSRFEDLLSVPLPPWTNFCTQIVIKFSPSFRIQSTSRALAFFFSPSWAPDQFVFIFTLRRHKMSLGYY